MKKPKVSALSDDSAGTNNENQVTNDSSCQKRRYAALLSRLNMLRDQHFTVPGRPEKAVKFHIVGSPVLHVWRTTLP